MNATVYTKPGCTQCNATYRALDKKGFPYQSVDISQDADAHKRLMDKGYMQAPVVEVFNPQGELVDDWSGFNPDKINEHALSLQGAQTV